MGPRLTRLWMDDFHDRKTIRLDWDNDRHHAIAIEGRVTVDDVRTALLEAARMIGNDRILKGNPMSKEFEEWWQNKTEGDYAWKCYHKDSVEALQAAFAAGRALGRREGSLEFTLAEAQELVLFFGGDEEGTMTVSRGGEDAHAGPGLYAYCTDYPEEGAVKLGPIESIPEEA